MRTLIQNVQIITDNHLLKAHHIIIEDGLIKTIDPNHIKPKDIDRSINGQGCYLSPGFIDIHTHGNTGHDVMDGTSKSMEKIATFHLANGVTSFLGSTLSSPTDVLCDTLTNLADYIDNQSLYTSDCLGIYLEGPFYNALKHGAQPKNHLQNPDLETLNLLLKASNHHIKVVSLAPEMPGAQDVIKALNKQHILVALGHSNATYDDTVTAIHNGAGLATHLYNGMRAFTHREPGIIGACLTHDQIMVELIADGVHLHKTAIDITKRCKTVDNIILITDAIRATGLDDGTYDLGGQTIISENGVVRLPSGALAGSTLTLRIAVQNMINHYNTSLIDAIKMVTINPAKVLGLEDIIGRIAPNMQADLVLFDNNINIHKVFKHGKIVYQKRP
jgi:N-acetylglucosamine-6-phosphate deacetylase